MNLSKFLRPSASIKACVFAAIAVSLPIQAQEAVKCDLIFNQVQASVATEPAKVLVIVEKEVRANESCACEIIKAAIQASHATADMILEIKNTAIAAAPAQEEIIKACIGSLKAASARDSGKEVVAVSGKNVIVDPPLVGQGDSTNDGDDDYFVIPPDIRGVYLIQPAAGGVFIVRQDAGNDRDDNDDDRRRRNPPRRPVPQSPSNATP